MSDIEVEPVVAEVRADPAWLRALSQKVRTMSTDLDEGAAAMQTGTAAVGSRLSTWAVGAALTSTSAGIWHDDAAVASFRVADVAGGLDRCATDYEATDHANAENMNW